MTENFPFAISHVLASEGGYVNNRNDPGGPTNKGITQHVYDNWRLSHGQPTRDVRWIDPNETEAIYRKLYWDAVSGDLLPSGVDYCVFDFAVNSGAHEAAKCLQRAVGVNDDGSIGPVTLAAVKAADPRRIINAVCAERMEFLQSLPTFPHFGLGWGRRVAEVELTARSMV